ncbi:DoxX family protein [Lusitaniella coriacea LEGE 07157]|uniref:DoxX family protein n=1 Tax=Lusitaniella coriacea LEGE 07157 TaxID=945747 RepID=A0A8J7DWA5_9CYAN|nr:DoxX family protein [Lusitaniella coriacea]MBE9115968.1 DoxX family protein [Lusitaniella coriacea LEGE 07157]
MIDFKRYERYESLILRVFLGLTLIFWGYEKLVLPKLATTYVKDYQSFLFVDVKFFLTIAGIVQIILGAMMIVGFYSRISAALLALMAIITIIIPGMIIIRDVPHFAYAFATAGGAIALLIRGSGAYSMDAKRWRRQQLANSQ